MTKTEFINAKRRFQREISWSVMAWFVFWLVVVFAVGAGFRFWFHDHQVISDIFISVAAVVFILPVWFISKHLHRKHHLVCPSCGHWMLTETGGRCPKCQLEIFRDA